MGECADMTKTDYGITIVSTAYDKYWVNCDIRETIGSPTTFNAVLNGTGTGDFSTIAIGSDFKLYEYDSAGSGTLRFLGTINSVKRNAFNQIEISGYDYGGKLINSNVNANTTASLKQFESGDTDTLGTIVNKLCSTNLDGGSPWIITVGTIADDTSIIGKFTVPSVSRWEALSLLAARAGKELYIDLLTGTLNMSTKRGNSSSVKTYYITGANTNAYSSSHEFTNNNVYNDIIAYGTSKDLTTRYQDMSTTFCKTTFSDTRVSTAVVGAGGGSITTNPITINVVSTDGFPSTGRVVIKQCTTGSGVGNIYMDYTSKTATSITGSLGLPAANSIPTGAPVLLTSVIKVDDNSSFPSSGSIVIGEELIDYSAKPDSTTFTVSQVLYLENFRYSRDYSLSSGTHTETSTTIAVADASGFPTTGVLEIHVTGYPYELVQYTGKSGNSFTGCIRGVEDTKRLAIPASSTVILHGHEGIHPKGVLVYKYVASADASSSIGLKGRRTYTLKLERASSIEDVEAQCSRFLELHKWGDQNATISVPTYFDYGAVAIGDKITLNDSTLSWSSYAVRVLEKRLTLDRGGGSYELGFVVATYSDNPAEGNVSKELQQFIMRMSGAKEGTVAQLGKDNDVLSTGEGRSGGGLNYGFQPPSGVGMFTNENKNGFVFSNNIWGDATSGASHWGTPFYFFGVSIDSTGLFFPWQKDDPDPTGVEGAIYYNTTSNTLRWYNGSAWADVGGGAGYWTLSSGILSPTTMTNSLLIEGGDGDGTCQMHFYKNDDTNFVFESTGSSDNIDLWIGAKGTGGIHLGGNTTPTTNNIYTNGGSSYRWSTIYGVNANITGTLSANGGVGSAGQVLTSNGASAAYWSTPSGSCVWTDAGTYIYPTGNEDVCPQTNLGADLGTMNRIWSVLYCEQPIVFDGVHNASLQMNVDTDNAYLRVWCTSGTANLNIGPDGGDIIFLDSRGGGLDYIRPESNDVTYLGHSSYRWKNVYAKKVDISGTGTELLVASGGDVEFGGTSDTFYCYKKVGTDLLPDSTSAFTLGSSSYKWSTVYSNSFGTASYRGNVYADALSKNSGSFQIHHPLDPKNKWLFHSFVESPDMMLIYKGRAKLENGKATIHMPEWFHALNGKCDDAEYSLTPIGKFSKLYVSKTISDFEFEVSGDVDCDFSWIVYTVRHDEYAEMHRIPIEREMTEQEKADWQPYR